MTGKSCRVLLIVFAAPYLIALGILMIDPFGLFGRECDPLAGVFPVPLGLP